MTQQSTEIVALVGATGAAVKMLQRRYARKVSPTGLSVDRGPQWTDIW